MTARKIADALSVAMGRDKGGVVALPSRVSTAAMFNGGAPFVGYLPAPTPGRTDSIAVNVPADAYVVPAHVVGALGEGNSAAGAAKLDRWFGPDGPFGVKGGRGRGGSRIPRPPEMTKAEGRAHGGYVNPDWRPRPIRAAGGEYIIPPEVVAKAGKGDISFGHDVLDSFVKSETKKLAKTISSLPGPKR